MSEEEQLPPKPLCLPSKQAEPLRVRRLLQLGCSLSEGVLLKIKAAGAGIAHQEEKNQSRPRVFLSVCLT